MAHRIFFSASKMFQFLKEITFPQAKSEYELNYSSFMFTCENPPKKYVVALPLQYKHADFKITLTMSQVNQLIEILRVVDEQMIEAWFLPDKNEISIIKMKV